jgi:hypothetical protein
VALLLAAPAWADVPPGFDLFETDPQQTLFSFRDQAEIPADFFDQGSAPFSGDVAFGGNPLLTFMGKDVGDADTVVERTQAAVLPSPFPATAQSPVELRALSLVGIEPIQVDVGGATQLWDVGAEASASRPSSGSIDIVQQSKGGGTFDSRLTVYPKFTFTRLSDGRRRVLDVGALPDGTRPDDGLVLSSSGVPWRPGCIPPALRVPGLNDGFCPGQTTLGPGAANVEQAALARHAVFPAQPRLEHFSCYPTPPRSRGAVPFSARLADQFGSSRASVRAPVTLCNPARKNREPFSNRRAHLSCQAMRVRSAFRARDVAVRNQFGSARLRVLRPVTLCAPALTSSVRQPRPPPPLRPPDGIDYYTCYRISTSAPPVGRRVTLVDQFGRRRASVLRPVSLCAPTRLNFSRLLHPAHHLVCYRVDFGNARFPVRQVRVQDKFGVEIVFPRRPAALCVPSLKLLL